MPVSAPVFSHDELLHPKYAASRQPVLADRVVATSQPLAAQAGLSMLARGGSAVDAAIAAAAVLTVVEPVSTGLGSDLFALVADGSNLVGLNASGRAPAAWTPAYFRGREAMPALGWDSVTIPGGVAGWQALSSRYGRLPFADLFVPAIRLARDGFLVSPVVAHKWSRNVERWAAQPGFAEAFLPRGRPPRSGERFALPSLADSLEKVAASAGESFYRGELAAAMADHAAACGAAQTEADFAGYACEWVQPLAQDYRGWQVHELPPNGQGIAALMALGILAHFDLAAWGPDHPLTWHVQIEAMKLAFADVHAQVADPAAMGLSAQAMLDADYLRRRAALIRLDQAQTYPGGLPGGGTVYLCAADERGMMVSLIQSTYVGFGSGVVVPGTGISLQNRGSGFSLQAGHPNQVAPGKRPFHTIIPAFLSREGMPVAAFGVMGGPMQPQGHVQIMSRILDGGQNPQTALDAPRWKVGAGLAVDIEAGMPETLLTALAARGHQMGRQPDIYLDMGAGQMAWRLPEGGYLAASDWRRDGCAVGF